MGHSPVTLSVDDSLAILRIGREHGNAINSAMVDRLRAATEEASGNGVRGMLLAADGKMFCPGLDLRELVSYDRPRMRDFMERFSEAMLALYTYPGPVVAAISGHALAGGCLLALTADRRVLCSGAMVGLNEVRVGVPLPYAQALMLREAVEPSRLEEVALLGRNFSADDAVSTGIVHEVRPREGFEQYCLGLLREMASRNPLAFATTKRYLRSATVAKIRSNDARLRDEFLDCWFSEDSRRRMRKVVTDLQGR